MSKITIIDGDDQILPYKMFHFPGGEIQIRLGTNKAIYHRYTIDARITDAEGLMELLLITDALRRQENTRRGLAIDLNLPYIPYARQDRPCVPGEALSLKVFADIINAQNYRQVQVYDSHSPVALALLDRVVEVPACNLVARIAKPEWIFVAPDAGATRRVSECAKLLKAPMVQAIKSRDPATGEITKTKVLSEHVGDKTFLIIDDICDGGRTFLELGIELRKLTTGPIYLYVTHGIFSKEFEVFKDIIDRIYCANVWEGKDNSMLVRI